MYFTVIVYILCDDTFISNLCAAGTKRLMCTGFVKFYIITSSKTI